MPFQYCWFFLLIRNLETQYRSTAMYECSLPATSATVIRKKIVFPQFPFLFDMRVYCYLQHSTASNEQRRREYSAYKRFDSHV